MLCCYFCFAMVLEHSMRFTNFENVRGKPLDVITLLMVKEKISLCYKLAAWFKKGTVIGKIHLTWRSLEKVIIATKCIVLTSTLRTKLIYNGCGIVMNLDNKPHVTDEGLCVRGYNL